MNIWNYFDTNIDFIIILSKFILTILYNEDLGEYFWFYQFYL